MGIKDYQLSKHIPEKLWPTIDLRDGAFKLAKILKDMYAPDKIANMGYEQQSWEYIGLYYGSSGFQVAKGFMLRAPQWK